MRQRSPLQSALQVAALEILHFTGMAIRDPSREALQLRRTFYRSDAGHIKSRPPRRFYYSARDFSSQQHDK
jgi:hypothetical protein